MELRGEVYAVPRPNATLKKNQASGPLRTRQQGRVGGRVRGGKIPTESAEVKNHNRGVVDWRKLFVSFLDQVIRVEVSC